MSSIAQILMDKWANNRTGLREDYRSKLMRGAWIVEFTKVDGTPATMTCTLDPRLLPPVKESTDDKAGEHKVDSPDVLPVYSLDRKGWRSFKIENVKAFYQKQEEL